MLDFQTVGNASKVMFFAENLSKTEDLQFKKQKIRIKLPFVRPTYDLNVPVTKDEILARLNRLLADCTSPIPSESTSDHESHHSDEEELRLFTPRERLIVRDRKTVLRFTTHHPEYSLKDISVLVGRSLKFVTQIFKSKSLFEIDYLRPSERSKLQRRSVIEQTVEASLRENLQSVSRDIKLNCSHRGYEVSRAQICNRLKKSGRKWRLNQAVVKQKHNKVLKPEQIPQLNQICRVVTSLTSQSQDGVFWEDEMKFPVSQVAKKVWGTKDHPGVSRPDEDQPCITAVVLCSKNGFQAIQFFERELKSEDYQFFLVNCIHKLTNQGLHVNKIIHDNAPWHQLKEGPAHRMLSGLIQANIPGWPMLNLIESTFSPVRMKYRSSVKGRGLQQRATNILQIFQNCNKPSAFAGMFRNYLRTLIKIVTDAKP